MSDVLTPDQIAAVRAIAAEMIGEALRGADQRFNCELDAIVMRVAHAEAAIASLPAEIVDKKADQVDADQKTEADRD